jgi:hypothetical protein
VLGIHLSPPRRLGLVLPTFSRRQPIKGLLSFLGSHMSRLDLRLEFLGFGKMGLDLGQLLIGDIPVFGLRLVSQGFCGVELRPPLGNEFLDLIHCRLLPHRGRSATTKARSTRRVFV